MRVRYFSDGLALRSKEFAESFFTENRDKFGPKRRDGARKVSESESPLYSLRRLRLRTLDDARHLFRVHSSFHCATGNREQN